MIVTIVYKNHRGETATRRITPSRLWFGATQWHHGEQWFLEAIDEDRGAERSFAMKDILEWKERDVPSR